MLISEGFQQTPYSLPLAWDAATHVRAVLRRLASREAYKVIDQDCCRLQERLKGDIWQLNQFLTEPKLTQYDQWGRRIDRLDTSEGWRGLKRIAAEEGMIDIPYKRVLGSFSRLHGFAKVYMFYPLGADVGCPMAMTDGAQRVFTLLGSEEMKQEYLPSLCSRDPNQAITAAQWMTERPGGSDVSMTETVAHPADPSNARANGAAYYLDGFKWFSSATDGDIALALARTSGEGSKGLSLFVVPMRKSDGTTNGIHIHRLKNKFGTKYLPTAELSISNAKARLVGELGRGVSAISSVLNITRTHSAMTGTASLGHALSIARGFAQVRQIGGKNEGLLMKNEMHTSALAQSELVHRAVVAFAFNIVLLLGKSEASPEEEGATPEEALRLRLLTPVLKTFSADLCTTELTKCMEALGGQGYMVENEFGTLIASANVERIWEGTTNTLALDVVRVIKGTQGKAVGAFIEWAKSILIESPASFASSTNTLRTDLDVLHQAGALYTTSQATIPDPRIPRLILYQMGYLASALHLLEQSLWSSSTPAEEQDHLVDALVFESWVKTSGARGTCIELQELLKKGDEDRRVDRQIQEEMVYGKQGARLAKL